MVFIRRIWHYSKEFENLSGGHYTVRIGSIVIIMFIWRVCRFSNLTVSRCYANDWNEGLLLRVYYMCFHILHRVSNSAPIAALPFA